MSEKHPGVASLAAGHLRRRRGDAVHVHVDPRTSTASRTAAAPDKSFFIVNHWLRPNGPPDPVAAGQGQLAEDAHRIACSSASPSDGSCPNVLAVDFTSAGRSAQDGPEVQRGGRPPVGRHRDHGRDRASAAGERHHRPTTELNALRRLPKISEKEARKLLGPLADSMPTPARRSWNSPTRARPARSHTRAMPRQPRTARSARVRSTTTSTTTTTVAARHGRRPTATPTPAPTPMPECRRRHAGPAVVPEGCVALNLSRSPVVHSTSRRSR